MNKTNLEHIVSSLIEALPKDTGLLYNVDLGLGFNTGTKALSRAEVLRYLKGIQALLAELEDTDELNGQTLISIQHPMTERLMEKAKKIYEKKAEAEKARAEKTPEETKKASNS